MNLDWRANSNRTFIGAVLVMVGLPLEIRVYTDIENTPVWLAFLAPMVLGLGAGMLLRQQYEIRRLRRLAREWAEEHPEEERQLWCAPEDDPNWVAWAEHEVDNPEKPTDETGEKG